MNYEEVKEAFAAAERALEEVKEQGQVLREYVRDTTRPLQERFELYKKAVRGGIFTGIYGLYEYPNLFNEKGWTLLDTFYIEKFEQYLYLSLYESMLDRREELSITDSELEEYLEWMFKQDFIGAIYDW